MKQKVNYQKALDEIIQKLMGRRPTLLLHSCCAPCSTYVLEYLSEYFDITVYYYNPNIFPEEEYNKRILEQQKLIHAMGKQHEIKFISKPYSPSDFYDAIKGVEHIPEGGERCFRCYRVRLLEACMECVRGGYDYFTTTLSISPMKNSEKLNEIGEELAKEHGVHYLPSDFKKRNGYLRSTQLSKEYGLYRQDYCGCVFSKKEHEEQINNSKNGMDINQK